jgi:L-fuculose-phosphate aldolase
MTVSTLSPAETLARYCRKVYERGLSPATSGNVSLRDGERVFITPTGFCLGEVEADDMVEMTLAGEQLSSRHKPSTEWAIHRELYIVRPDVRAVLHAHPPKATALAAAHKTIDQPLIAEVIISLGEIPLVPYTLPGTDALAHLVGEHIGNANAVLLANHGAIAVGRSMQDAFYHLEFLESIAEVYILANSLPGGAKPLSEAQVNEIIKHQNQKKP